MFFNLIPNIVYDKKPLSYPFSNVEYVLAKNFFKKIAMDDTSFSYSVYFNKYIINDGERPDSLSQKFYGDTGYDWVILITNNIINPIFDYPIEENKLYDMVTSKYGSGNEESPHHYMTYQVLNGLGEEIQKAGLIVDESFYNGFFKFPNRTDASSGAVNYYNFFGPEISFPVSNYQYEQMLNDKKREIYILNPSYLNDFVSQFTSLAEYSLSNSYINNNTKTSGI